MKNSSALFDAKKYRDDRKIGVSMVRTPLRHALRLSGQQWDARRDVHLFKGRTCLPEEAPVAPISSWPDARRIFRIVSAPVIKLGSAGVAVASRFLDFSSDAPFSREVYH